MFKNIRRIASWEIRQALSNKVFVTAAVVIPLIINFLLLPLIPPVPGAANQPPYLIGLLDKSGVLIQNISRSVNTAPALLVNNNNKQLSFSENVRTMLEQLKAGKIYHAVLIFDGERSPEIIVAPGFVYKSEEIKQAILTTVSTSPNPVLNMVISDLRKGETKVIRDGMVLDSNVVSTAVLLSVILIILFFSTISMAGNWFIRGFSEEKNNRLIEVLLTSISKRELLSGKFLGLFLLSMLQNLIIFVVAIVLPGARAGLFELLQNPALTMATFSTGAVQFLLLYLFIGWKAKSELTAQMSGLLIGLTTLIPLLYILLGPAEISGALSFIPVLGTIFTMISLQSIFTPVTEYVLPIACQVFYTVLIFMLLTKQTIAISFGGKSD